MKRLRMKEMLVELYPHFAQVVEDAYSEQMAREEAFGLIVAGKLADADRFIAMDVRELRAPPSGWTFAEKIRAKLEDRWAGITFGDEEARDATEFWRWYLPVESNVLQLCALLAFFGAAAHREVHRMHLDALHGFGIELREKYDRHRRDGQIEWLPMRLHYRGKPCDIVQYLGAHLIADPVQPPRWATERIEAPMEMPF